MNYLSNRFMHLFLYVITLIISFNTFSRELTFSVSGTDKIPLAAEYQTQKNFLIYENKFQFETNTRLYGYGNCSGTVEIVNGEEIRNILCIMNDISGEKGYMMSRPPQKNDKITTEGNRITSSIATWEFVGGSGPWKELIGVVITGAYFSMGQTANMDNNFMWKGKANISDEIINNINK